VIHGISSKRITGDFIRNRFAAHFNAINYDLIHTKRGRQGTHERDEYGKNLHHPERHIEQHNFGSTWMNMLELKTFWKGAYPSNPKPFKMRGPKVPIPPAGRAIKNISVIQHQDFRSVIIANAWDNLKNLFSSP